MFKYVIWIWQTIKKIRWALKLDNVIQELFREIVYVLDGPALVWRRAQISFAKQRLCARCESERPHEYVSFLIE